jgi:CBS domain-containing protein
MNQDAALPVHLLEAGTSIVQAQPWRTAPVQLDSPAVEVMTDLKLVKAATISPTATLAQAEQAMIYLGVRMLLVVSAMPTVEGLITANDVRGDRAIQVVQQRHVHHDELCVADVMTGLTTIDAIDADALRTATVSNVIATLKRHGRNHLLVVEAGAGEGQLQQVCGVFSRAQIERQLGQRIEIVEVAGSFAEIERVLA